MTSPSRKKLTGTTLALFLLIAAGSAVYAYLHAGPWIVPEAAKQVPNPLKPSQADLTGARRLYDDKCAECHGQTGKGDGDQSKMYNTPPANFTDAAHMNSMTDGELFYKITEGHRPMPGFKKRYSDEQRWQLVLLLRNFAQPPQK